MRPCCGIQGAGRHHVQCIVAAKHENGLDYDDRSRWRFYFPIQRTLDFYMVPSDQRNQVDGECHSPPLVWVVGDTPTVQPESVGPNTTAFSPSLIFLLSAPSSTSSGTKTHSSHTLNIVLLLRGRSLLGKLSCVRKRKSLQCRQEAHSAKCETKKLAKL